MTTLRAIAHRAGSRVAPLVVTASVTGALLLLSASSVVAAAYGPHDKVMVCHNGHEITVSRNAQQAHMDHGDDLGACE